MTKKKTKDEKIKVKASKADFTEAGTGIGLLCLWACSAFSMEPTVENAKAMYALAQTRARDARTAGEFASMWK